MPIVARASVVADPGRVPLCATLERPTTTVVGHSAWRWSPRSGQTGRTFSACGPFWPWVMSNSTRWFSSNER